MKNAKLIIDGKEIEVQINEEVLKKLTATDKTTGYERVCDGSTYYTDSCGIVKTFEERSEHYDEKVYKSGSYYSDPDVAFNNIRADNLMRQLRRIAVENRKSNIDWTDKRQNKYYLDYDYRNQKICIDFVMTVRDFGQIYFDTRETAKLAIKKFKDELLWYFTEYRDSLFCIKLITH